MPIVSRRRDSLSTVISVREKIVEGVMEMAMKVIHIGYQFYLSPDDYLENSVRMMNLSSFRMLSCLDRVTRVHNEETDSS